jgi:predicted transcriptional regulator
MIKFLVCLAVISAALNGCDTFRRFEQISFTCTSVITGPFELRVTEREVGDLVTLLRPTGEQQLPIIAASNDMLSLSEAQIDWIVDLDKKKVFLQRGKQAATARCDVKNFSM